MRVNENLSNTLYVIKKIFSRHPRKFKPFKTRKSLLAISKFSKWAFIVPGKFRCLPFVHDVRLSRALSLIPMQVEIPREAPATFPREMSCLSGRRTCSCNRTLGRLIFGLGYRLYPLRSFIRRVLSFATLIFPERFLRGLDVTLGPIRRCASRLTILPAIRDTRYTRAIEKTIFRAAFQYSAIPSRGIRVRYSAIRAMQFPKRDKTREILWIYGRRRLDLPRGFSPLDFPELLEEIYSRESDGPSCDETYDRFLRTAREAYIFLSMLTLTAAC
ncbi:hypothetical protein PUN28_004275 [Cardiocondyla obscurior]|uniref:Uncharacterized protein n=1 Tax=Cardiocondyla obscurior TaxID=286306 RepID=A0AAW2GAI2_9HYME